MVGAMGNMADREESLLNLYVFRCYLLCPYDVLTVILCSAVVSVNSNFRTLSDCQD